MPNNMIIPKGPYVLQRLNRRQIEHQEKFRCRLNNRLYVPKPKMSFIRVLKLTGYFCIFYLVLGLFAWCYMQLLFFGIAKDDQPLMIKTPGLSAVPGHLVGVEKQIVWRSDLTNEIGPLMRQIDDFVKPYGIEGERFLRPCNLDNNWGYTSRQPCILLKLNYSQNFTVFTYNDGITLPDEAPMALYNYLTQAAEEMRRNRIWINCEFMGHKEDAYFDYIPYRYYDADGLFQKQHDYLQFVSENLTEIEVHEDPAYRRVLGVQVLNLPTNMDIHCKCAVWAKNIPLNLGTVKFMLHLIEVVENKNDIE
ncbi:sodium/potassium-transporting ATPase subunit beta-1 [Drosophila tropicalis]|uniref:sodium/potassium-transporting ATPase subunit beta-1 n=1 Tax=Drosophila tropicalis TaxID=46794 RepID=UPI0035AC1DCD